MKTYEAPPPYPDKRGPSGTSSGCFFVFVFVAITAFWALRSDLDALKARVEALESRTPPVASVDEPRFRVEVLDNQ